MHAKVNVTDAKGRGATGDYLLVWVSEARWREEITFPGYQRIRIGEAGRYWQRRTANFESDRIFQLAQAIDFVPRLLRNAQSTSGKAKGRKRQGKHVNCAAVRPKDYADQEACFSADQGTLVREDLPRGESDGQSEISTREYSDFVSFGEKLFPRSIRVLAGHKPIITISVDELTPQTGLAPSVFVVPAGVEAWQSCFAPSRPVPLQSNRSPHYPEHAKAFRVSGLVRMYAVVGVGGQLDRVTLVHSPDPELSTAGMDAV